jgi:O-methyltransferase
MVAFKLRRSTLDAYATADGGTDAPAFCLATDHVSHAGERMLLNRIQRMLQLARLDAVTRGVVRDKLTYLSFDKLDRLNRAIEQADGVKGDFLEFGVALGGSAILLAHHIGASRRFLGFDVFGMIPPPTSDKDDAKSKSRYETIRSGQSKGINGDEYYGYKRDLYSQVSASFTHHGVPVDGKRVLLYKGLFEETWPTVEIDAIALVHLDCDWYDPVAYCLRACADKMSSGGAIVIDDYHDYGGCRTAVDEFLAARSDFRFEAGPNPILRKS